MTSKIIIISLILGSALLGGYATMFTSYRYGYFDALRKCVSSLPNRECVLDMSDAVIWKFTGIPQIDDLINILLEFFSQGLRRHPEVQGIDLEAFLAFTYLAAQFGGAWYIIALEGLRHGNQRTILSWTGVFGLAFQAVTITIIAPIYLALQLIGQSSNLRPEALLVDPWDLSLLPISSILAYIVPTIGLCLPLLNLASGEVKLFAVAFWQPFPIYHSLIRGTSQVLFGKTPTSINKPSTADLKSIRQVLRRSNRIIAVLSVVVHLAVMVTHVISSSTDLVAKVSGHHILALTSLQRPPMEAMLRPPVSLLESREIVVSFLRWDVYCTCFAMLTWSAYQNYMLQGPGRLLALGVKAVFYAFVGGPIFPALMFIWERDEKALDKAELGREVRKSAKDARSQGDLVANGKSRKQTKVVR